MSDIFLWVPYTQQPQRPASSSEVRDLSGDFCFNTLKLNKPMTNRPGTSRFSSVRTSKTAMDYNGLVLDKPYDALGFLLNGRHRPDCIGHTGCGSVLFENKVLRCCLW
jgi:hypothetical protein